MGREKSERDEKEEEERSRRKVGLGLNAGGSAPVTLAPSQGSIFEILFARGLFVRNFRKKAK